MLKRIESPTIEAVDSEFIGLETNIVVSPTDKDFTTIHHNSARDNSFDDEPDIGMYRDNYEGHEILSEDEDVFIDEEVRMEERRNTLFQQDRIETDAIPKSLQKEREQRDMNSRDTAEMEGNTREILSTNESKDIDFHLQLRTSDLLAESRSLRKSKLERESSPPMMQQGIIEAAVQDTNPSSSGMLFSSPEQVIEPISNEKQNADEKKENEDSKVRLSDFESRLRLLESKAKSGLSRVTSKNSIGNLDSTRITSESHIGDEEVKSNAMRILANVEERIQNRDTILQDLHGWASHHLNSKEEEAHSFHEYENNLVSSPQDENHYNEELYNSIFQSDSDDEIPHEESLEEGVLFQKYKRHDRRNIGSEELFEDPQLIAPFPIPVRSLTQRNTAGERRQDRMAVLGIQNVSESYHLELEVITLREENQSTGQKLMNQLEQNQILRQDLDIVTDKYRSLEKRSELVDKVNRQKQMEFEKKTKIYTKTIEDLQKRVNTLQEEKLLSNQNYEAQTQSLIFEVSMNAEKARQKESALKALQERFDSLEQTLRSTKASLKDSSKIANQLELDNKALIAERDHKQSEVESLKQETKTLSQQLREELKKVSQFEKTIAENIAAIEELKANAWERDPEPEDIRKSVPMKSVSIQTVEKPLEKKKMIRKQFEATTLNYLDMSRTACGSVKKSHDEFVSRLLHVVRNQIPDTMTQFLNYFGAKNHVSDIVVDEWIERLRQTYEKHINAVRLMSEKQNNLYNDVFNRKDMSDTQKEILSAVDKILFEDNDDGFRIEQENQVITQEMYNEITMQMRSLHNEAVELREENEMLKAHITVMERTQGKLSNVAELERQLKRCQVKLETAQEEYEEYFAKSVALEQDLEQLKSAVRRSNLIILTEEGAYMPGEVEGQEQLRNKPQLVRIQSQTSVDSGMRQTSSNDSMLSIESIDSRERQLVSQADSKGDGSIIPVDSRTSPRLPPMPQRRQSQISLQSLLEEGQQYRGKDNKDIYEEGKQIAQQMKEQLDSIDGAIKLLVGKVTEHERKKLKRTDVNAPEWLLSFVDERSTELMRAAERLVVKYIKLAEVFEKKIDTFMILEQKLMEKEVGEYKELSELNFLRMTEDTLQQYLDQLMIQACQHYPLRSVSPQYVQSEILGFLEKQPVVLQEILPNVLSKIITLHKACTNYIDQLLQETDEELEALTEDDFSVGLSHKAVTRLQTVSRRQSTGSILTEESHLSSGSALMTNLSGVPGVNPEFEKANQILGRANELKEERVAARFLYWVYRLKLQKLKVELFAIESKSGPDENQVLIQNFQTQIALQKRHCSRLQRRLKKIERRVNRNLAASLATLVSWMKGEKKVLQQRLYERSSAGRRHRIQNASVPENELLSSSWKYSAKRRELQMSGKSIRPTRLQLKTREPLEREKLIHLQKPSKVAEKNPSPSPPLLQEQRVPQGSFSIFRPKTETTSQRASFFPKVASTSNVPQGLTTSTNTAHASHSAGSSGHPNIPSKVPRRVTRTAGTIGAYGIPEVQAFPPSVPSSNRHHRHGK